MKLLSNVTLANAPHLEKSVSADDRVVLDPFENTRQEKQQQKVESGGMIFSSTYPDFLLPAPLYWAHTWSTRPPLKTRRKSCKMCRHCWIWNIRTRTFAADWLIDGWRHFLFKMDSERCQSFIGICKVVSNKENLMSSNLLCKCNVKRDAFVMLAHYHKGDSTAYRGSDNSPFLIVLKWTL